MVFVVHWQYVVTIGIATRLHIHCKSHQMVQGISEMVYLGVLSPSEFVLFPVGVCN